jgi:hypothetical protein
VLVLELHHFLHLIPAQVLNKEVPLNDDECIERVGVCFLYLCASFLINL